MSDFRRGAAQPKSILSTLQETAMLDSDSKPVLPAEILAAILDHVPIQELMRCARVSRRMREMVYDDTRWVSRLKSIGCWNEAEARTRFEVRMKRRHELAGRASAGLGPGTGAGTGHDGGKQDDEDGTTLFDAAVDQRRSVATATEHRSGSLSAMADGFESTTVGPAGAGSFHDGDADADADSLLTVIAEAKSIRGQARLEYGKIYGALAPFYLDLARARSHTDPAVFQLFRDPERQARMLANLNAFARSDWAPGWRQRGEKLSAMMAVFESAVLREFEQGYEVWDVDGRMNKYAGVLHILNGGGAALELFIQKHPLFSDKEVLANPSDCLRQTGSGSTLVLEPSRLFFQTLTRKINEQADLIGKIFPGSDKVFWALMDKVREDIMMEYCTLLFDETHERGRAIYLQAVSALFEQTLHFFRTIARPGRTAERPDGEQASPDEDKAREMALKTFEPHLDLYLQEEVDHFTREAEREVGEWETRLSQQDATVESFYMANFKHRQADKKDFLTSFKKAIMMPASVLPSMGLPLSSSSVGTKSKSGRGAGSDSRHVGLARESGRTERTERAANALPEQARTDEVAAKAGLMTCRLEGIRSLFSIDVALKMVHEAKTALARIAVFTQLRGQAGGEAREQCQTVFVLLLRTLGNGHIKPGFDKALQHLSDYQPRTVEAGEHDRTLLAPLMTFIELVNLGDLISQMIDVFYEQQLAGRQMADRNDFLDPAGLAKKKFEQMLDESVAAGLNKGIDVLMDEVEYLCATTQQPGDYNPAGESAAGAAGAAAAASWMVVDMDVGPSTTARRVHDLVASHTGMLAGSTDKSMLDVFNAEVGLRLFASLCKHLKRQRVSTQGAVRLIADMNLYWQLARTSLGGKNADLQAYFTALRELSQLYLIDARRHAKEMAVIIADADRFGGVFRAEEVYEYATRRADWYLVKRDVERAMYGLECSLM